MRDAKLGDNNPNFGKNLSPEHCAKMSDARKEWWRIKRKHRAIKELRELGWPVAA